MEYLFAGVLGFLGVLFTGAVTLVGFLMKWSFDSHSLRLQKDAEDRLRMETAIRAVALMSTPSGADSPPNQQAGALFALGSLGQLEFALGLLRQMWPSARVDSASAVWLINQAFMSKSENSQEEAADILLQNASLLSTSGKAMV